ncbi:hypothetical protein F4818DRAFT_446521 [Hypoxylon cercidicola]|nr:hypothetical protein F4818DRAFT_446521 [Hypoxylon cercidicola]
MSFAEGDPPFGIGLTGPPGVSHLTLLGIQWSGTGFSILVVTARLAVRLKIFRKLQIDDYFIIAATILNIAWCITCTVIGRDLYAFVDSSRTPTSSQEDLFKHSTRSLRGNLINYIIMWSCLWAIKFSFMAFFYGLGNRIKSQRILWWGVLAMIVASYAVSIGLLDYQCLGSPASDFSGISYVALHFAWSTLTGVVILSGNIVWRARIPLKKKLALTFFCSLTVFMVVIAIIRVTGTDDITWLQLCNSIEMTVAIFVACFASFRSLYSHSKSSRQDGGPTAFALRSPGREHIVVQSTFSTDVTSNEYSIRTQSPNESQDVLWADQKVSDTSTVISS